MLDNTNKLPEWDLSDLYDKPNSIAFEKDFDLLKSLVEEFQKEYKDKILLDINNIYLASEKIKRSIISYEKIINLIGKLSAYATLHHVTATNDALRTKFYGDTQARITDAANKIIFYELELNKISDDTFNDLLNTESLIPYKTWFDNVRKYKPH
jgi:oligoendopeptidase F